MAAPEGCGLTGCAGLFSRGSPHPLRCCSRPAARIHPRRFAIVGGLLLFILLLVLFLSPRLAPGETGATPANASPLYSSYYAGLIVFAISISLASVGGCASVAVFNIFAPRYGQVAE